MKRIYLSSLTRNSIDELAKSLLSALKEAIKGDLKMEIVQSDDFHALIEINDEENPIDCDDLRSFIVNRLGLNFEGVQLSIYNYKPEVSVGFNFMKKSGHAFDKTVDKINELKYELMNNIIGQDHAIDVLVNGLIKALSMSKNESKKPLASFVFAGANHTGKTTMAVLTAQILDLPLMVFGKQDYLNKDQFFATLQMLNMSGKRIVTVFNDFEEMGPDILSSICYIKEVGEIGTFSLKNLILFFITSAGKEIYEKHRYFDYSSLTTQEVIDALTEERDENGRPIFFDSLFKMLEITGAVLFNNLSDIHRQYLIARSIENYKKELLANTGITVKGNEYELARFILFANPEENDVSILIRAAQKLVDDQVNFLIKSVNPENGDSLIKSVRNVGIKLDLNSASEDVKKLFADNVHKGLIVANEQDLEILRGTQIEGVELSLTSNIEEAKKIIDEEVDFIFLDPTLSTSENALALLDVEDYDGDGMKLFNHVTRYRNNTPLYLFIDIDYARPSSSYTSLLNLGAKGFAILDKQNLDDFSNFIKHLAFDAELKQDLEFLKEERLRLEYNARQNVGKTKDGENILVVNLSRLSLNPAIVSGQDIRADELRFIRKLDDVIGIDVAKKVLVDASEYLSNTQGYIASGAKPQRLIFVYGGTASGKTSLIKAVAKNAKADWVRFDCKEVLLRSDQHDVVKAIRTIFAQARKSAPTLLHLDNIAYLIRAEFNFAAEKFIEVLEEELLITQKDYLHPVLVVAEANNSHLRIIHPGLQKLISREVYVEMHRVEDVEEFVRRVFERKNITTISKKGLHNFAHRCMRYNYRLILDVIDFCIAQAKGQPLNDEILADGVDLYAQGDESKFREVTEQERLQVSYHEMGHYLLMRLFGDKPIFVTVIARGDYGGYTMPGKLFGPRSKKEYLDDICVSFGGRAAEVLLVGEDEGINAGVYGDIQMATQSAYIMVAMVAMGETLSFYNQVEAMGTESNLRIHEQIDKILKEQYERSLRLLELNRANLDLLAKALNEKGFMMGEDIEELLPDDKLIRE